MNIHLGVALQHVFGSCFYLLQHIVVSWTFNKTLWNCCISNCKEKKKERGEEIHFIITKEKLSANANYCPSFDISRAVTFFTGIELPRGSISIQEHVNMS